MIEIEIDRKEFLEACTQMYGVTEQRSTMPILATVHVSVKENAVTLTATDLFMTLRTDVPCTVHKRSGETQFVIHCKDLIERLKLLKSPKISISWSGKLEATCKIFDKKVSFGLKLLASDAFPVCALWENKDPAFELDSTFLHQLESAIPCATNDVRREWMNCVLFEYANGRLNVVATNGHLVHISEACSLVSQKKKDVSFMIPLKIANELVSFMKANQKITLDYEEQTSHFSVICRSDKGELSFRSNTTTQFPPYRQIIPTNTFTIVEVERDEFVEATRTCSVIRAQTKGSSSILYQFSHKEIDIVAQSADGDDANTTVSYQSFEGRVIDIALNPSYVIAVTNKKNGLLKLSMNDSLSPIVIDWTSEDGNITEKSVVMPVRR